jgi:hypothetical protein
MLCNGNPFFQRTLKRGIRQGIATLDNGFMEQPFAFGEAISDITLRPRRIRQTA